LRLYWELSRVHAGAFVGENDGEGAEQASERKAAGEAVGVLGVWICGRGAARD